MPEMVFVETELVRKGCLRHSSAVNLFLGSMTNRLRTKSFAGVSDEITPTRIADVFPLRGGEGILSVDDFLEQSGLSLGVEWRITAKPDVS